jgi:hypothetical protein
MAQKLKHYELAVFQICFHGVNDESWIEYLNPEMTMQVVRAIISILTGSIVNQATFLGLLNHLYNPGLPLISVYYLMKYYRPTWVAPEVSCTKVHPFFAWIGVTLKMAPTLILEEKNEGKPS